jgi:hypothetical protein
MSVQPDSAWQQDRVIALAWSPSARFLASVIEDPARGVRVQVWEELSRTAVASETYDSVTALAWTETASPPIRLSLAYATEQRGEKIEYTLHMSSIGNDVSQITFEQVNWDIDTQALLWSADSHRLLIGTSSSIAWSVNPNSIEDRYELQSTISSMTAMDWSDNHALLAFGNADGVVQIWDSSSGVELYRYLDFTGMTIRKLRLSPGLEYIAALNANGRIVVWEIGTERTQYINANGTDFEWLSDGRSIVVASANAATAQFPESVQLWEIQPQEPTLTCSRSLPSLVASDMEAITVTDGLLLRDSSRGQSFETADRREIGNGVRIRITGNGFCSSIPDSMADTNALNRPTLLWYPIEVIDNSRFTGSTGWLQESGENAEGLLIYNFCPLLAGDNPNPDCLASNTNSDGS